MVFSTGLFVGIVVGMMLGAAIVYTAVLLGERVARGDQPLDEALDPGEEIGQLPIPEETAAETTGPIRRVGETSGRHAKPEWPDSEDGPEMDTSVMVPVGQEVNA